MKKYYFLIIALLFIGSAQKVSAQKKAKLKDFDTLNKFKANEWLTGNFEISNTFETIYKEHAKKNQFKKQLIKYTNNNINKIYWLATYLNDDYYNEIKDKTLSFEIFKYGLAKSKKAKENEQIRFLFIVGKLYYYQGEEDKSLKYLLPAYELSQKHPGNVPTWNSLKESEEIYNFIKKNL